MIKGILFQEELRKEPFWMLVACVLVNRTKWMQAEPVFENLRRKWPTQDHLKVASERELADFIRPLGFYNRRAHSLVQLAREFGPQIRKATQVTRLTGCGQYASDSWAIFVEGRRDVSPTDVELVGWLEREKLRGFHAS